MNVLSARSTGRFALAILAGVGATLVPSIALAQQQPPPPPPPPEVDAPVPQQTPATTTPTQTPTPAPTQQGGGRYLLLPDISLNGIFLGHLSTDKRDQDRNKLRLGEAEVAVQSYVYPDVKLDTFIVFSGEGETNVEEAYLTFQKVSLLGQTMSAVVGRRKAPFGRVNQLHPHSWLYAVQPYALTNLVSPESLTGDGGYLSYLLPTGKVFTQLDLGYWSQSEAAEDIPTGIDPATNVVTSPGAGFEDKFGTARLLVATEALGGSLELGGSVAGGRGVSYGLNEEQSVRPDILLTGLDVTYRRAGTGTSRLLLRGEYINHHQKDHDFTHNADGWYVFADKRLDAFNSVGLRYDSSDFPYAPGTERGISLIGTHQLTEATLFRLQYLHGSRPGKQNFDELYFQIIFGVGPHTHNLE